MASETVSTFNYDLISEGFYHLVTQGGNPIRRAWHLHKFERVLECLPQGENLSLLDVGCFAGTFLSLVPEKRFAKQLGVDILPKQIAYANRHFQTDFREFRAIKNLDELADLPGTFDCITFIEVIEHLDAGAVKKALQSLSGKLNPGGKLVVSTPNYTSAWPILEVMLNRFSDITYEEQHLTRFNFFNVESKLKRIWPEIDSELKLRFKTTTHFLSPFLAGLSMKWAAKAARLYPHQDWHFPFGNLILLQFERR